MTLQIKLAAATSLLILFGCNQKEVSQTIETDQYSTITAQDIVSYSPENTVATLDLSSAISVDNGESVRLSSIEPLSDYNQCTVVEKKGEIAYIDTEGSQVCRFAYTAEANISQSHSTGIAQVIVTENKPESFSLNPLTRTTLHSSETQISLQTILPASTHVNEESLELFGTTSSGALGEVFLDGETLYYTSPKNTSGAIRLFYTAQDEQLTQVHQGVVYITISETNTAPKAQTETTLIDKVLTDYPSKRFLIDVRDYISDDDSNDLQLVEVYTNGLGTREILPWSTKFEYTPSQSGEHYINYVVTDHYGGYAVGSLHFKVLYYASIYDEQQDITFSPTYTMEELSRMNGSYSGTFIETGETGDSGYYPTFHRDLAQAYCMRKGQKLPSRNQILMMFQNTLKSQPIYQTSYQWPSGMSYVGSDGTFSLYDGTVSPDDTAGYLTCISSALNPTEYSFDSKYYAAGWGESTMISASQEVDAYERVSLAPDKYELEYQITSTTPENLFELVDVKIHDNQVIVSRNSDLIKTAILELRSPNVAGNQNTTSLMIGLTACPQDVTVEETQILGCVPIIYEQDGPAFTAALSNQILSQIGFNVFNSPPSALKQSNTYPNYSYFDPNILGDDHNLHSDLAPFLTPFCEKLNESFVAGRNNWAWTWDDALLGALPTYNRDLQGSFATEVTNWMSESTNLDSGTVGQGFFSLTSENLLYQSNQVRNTAQIVTQGVPGKGYSTLKQWQFITCVSAP